MLYKELIYKESHNKMYASQRAGAFSVSFALSCLFLQIECFEKLPEYIKPCSRSSPSKEFQQCLKENINSITPYLAGGIPKLRIPSQDPYYVERVVSHFGAFRGEFFNVTVTGASNFTITDLNLDLENSVLTMHLNYAHVMVQAVYKFVGNLLLFQLDSTGDGWVTGDDINIYLKMHGKLRQEKEKTFLDFNDHDKHEMILKYNGKAEIQLDNLFKDEVLTRATNILINNNFKEIINELMPLLKELISPNIFISTKGVFNVFPIDILVLS